MSDQQKDAAWDELFKARKEVLRCAANCIAMDFSTAGDSEVEQVVDGELEVDTAFDDALYVACDRFTAAMKKVTAL